MQHQCKIHVLFAQAVHTGGVDEVQITAQRAPCIFTKGPIKPIIRTVMCKQIWSWSSPGLMDAFHLMKERVFHAENEDPVRDGIQGPYCCFNRFFCTLPIVLRGRVSIKM